MKPIWIIVIVTIAILLLFLFFIWHQNRRARKSFKRIDYSKLNDLDNDGWDDR